MELANFGGTSSQPRRSLDPWSRVGTALVVLSIFFVALLLKTTLASNVNINTGGSVEFGQGLVVTTSCDSSLTLTPYASSQNDSQTVNFYFSGFSLSNLDANACSGVTFTLKAYASGSSSPLSIFSGANSVAVSDSGTVFVPSQAGIAISDTSTYSSVGKFTVSFDHPIALAKDVSKLTIETSGIPSALVASIAYNTHFDPSPYYQVSGLGGYAVVHPDGHVCGVIVATSSDPFGNGGTMTNPFMGCPAGSLIILETKPSPSGNVAGWFGPNVTYSGGTFTLTDGTTIYEGIATDLSGRIWDTGSGLTLNAI